MTDDQIIKSFPRYEGPGASGFITDFLGTKTRTSYISGLAKLDGTVIGYPIPDGCFHATPVEWAGAMRAARDAKKELVAVELGAGWGPWLVTLARAARIKGIHKVNLVGVEGSKAHFDFMLSHFADNGLDPRQHTLLHGVVGTTDGEAEFPIDANPATDWGTKAIYGEAESPVPDPGSLVRRGYRRIKRAVRLLVKGRPQDPSPSRGAVHHHSGTERVKCFSIPTLLSPFAKVDLVHVDIQGDEFNVLSSARQVLKAKVKRILVGTHSRSIEEQLLHEMASQNWELEREEACKYAQHGSQMHLVMDGCQIWRNKAIA